MQLDACLRSIEKNAPYTGPITVIYSATTSEFGESYTRLSFGDRVRLVEQGDFRADVMDALDVGSDCTVFQTDDSIFFRESLGVPVLAPEAAAFSLRLGLNTAYCYALARPQELPALLASGPYLAWNWTRATDDFAYPMSLDGHLISTELVHRMLARARFSNPNELEDELNYRRHLAPPFMFSFRESCLVSLPINIVTATHRNRSGDVADWSAGSLNQRFLSGQRIALDAMNFSGVRGAADDVELEFADLSD